MSVSVATGRDETRLREQIVRFGKSIFEKTWTVNSATRRLFTIVPNNSSQHVPGNYQVEVREEGLAVVRVPFVVTEPQ